MASQPGLHGESEDSQGYIAETLSQSNPPPPATVIPDSLLFLRLGMVFADLQLTNNILYLSLLP